MKKLFTILCVCSIAYSCSREGLHGKANIIVYPNHHSTPIINHIGYSDTVYVKFNATDLPGTNPSAYDCYFVGDPRTNFVNCLDLKWGDYYFYVAGFDSTILGRVTGGAHIKIRQRDKRSTKNVDIAVSE